TPVKVSILGCIVNGPGEAREADLGIAAGKGKGVIFKRGEIIRHVLESEMVDARRPVVLVMGGGRGPVPLDKVLASLQLCHAPMQVLAVAGHDRYLRHRMELMRGRLALDLHLFGW